MFEKKAEEIANKRCYEIMCYGHCSFSSPKHHRCGEWHREYECALKGAEFGYNKGYHDAEEHYLNVIDNQHKLVDESKKKDFRKCMKCTDGTYQSGFKDGYNKAIEWFDARTSIPLPKKAEIYRYTLEVISDKGDIVCYDYKDKNWKKLVIEDEKVTYVSVEIEKWCNKPRKESE